MLKQITEKRLYNITLAYLSRFEASSDKVRTMLRRRLAKAHLSGQEIPPQANEWIENVITKMRSYRYIDDERYARNQIRILSHRGKSSRYIQQKLAQEGIQADIFQQIMDETDTTDLDRAIRYVRRKKLGLFRAPSDQESHRDKDLASLARQGFSYEVAEKALKTPPTDTPFS